MKKMNNLMELLFTNVDNLRNIVKRSSSRSFYESLRLKETKLSYEDFIRERNFTFLHYLSKNGRVGTLVFNIIYFQEFILLKMVTVILLVAFIMYKVTDYIIIIFDFVSLPFIIIFSLLRWFVTKVLKYNIISLQFYDLFIPEIILSLSLFIFFFYFIYEFEGIKAKASFLLTICIRKSFYVFSFRRFQHFIYFLFVILVITVSSIKGLCLIFIYILWNLV